MNNENNNPSFLAIIPARYGSSRFPGKPLAKVGGVEMIARVMKRVERAGIETVVATDDVRIAECVEAYGGYAMLTSEECVSGTDRAYEALCKLDNMPDVIINVQGDEPFIDPSQIRQLMDIFRRNPETKIATLVRRFDQSLGFDALADPNLVKVVRDYEGNALYFSRSVIPYVRKAPEKQWLEKAEYFTHVGIYAYRSDILGKIASLPRSPLEVAESLEQLRWLQAGIQIATAVTNCPTIGIDTPADLDRAEEWIKTHQI